MDHFAGLDVPVKETSICIVDVAMCHEEKSIRRARTVRSSEEASPSRNACYYQYGQDFLDDMPSLAILGRG